MTRRGRRIGWTLLAVLAVGAGAWWLHREATDAGVTATPRQRAANLIGEGPTLAAAPAQSRGPSTSAAAFQDMVVADAAAWLLRGTASRKDGRDVAGVEIDVTFVVGDTERKVGTVVSGAEGSFQLDLRALEREGRLRLEAGTLRLTGWLAETGLAREEYELEGQFGALAERGLRVVLTLGDVPPLLGRVVTTAGEPVPRATVRAKARPEATAFYQTQTDAQGRFVIERPSSVACVCALVPEIGMGSVRAEPEVVTYRLPDLVLQPVPFVAGHVRYRDGAPVAAIGVWLQPADGLDDCGTSWHMVRTLSGPDGSFRVALPRGGKGRVSVVGAATTEVTAGDDRVLLLIEGVRVRFRLTTPEGQPVEEFAMGAHTWSPEHAHALDDLLAGRIPVEEAWEVSDFAVSRTDADGRFDAFATPGGAVQLISASTGFLPVEQALRVPEQGNEVSIDLVLRPADRIGSLRVRWATPGGEPVPGSRAVVRTAQGTELGSALWSTPLDLHRLPVGRHVLALQCDPRADRIDKEPADVDWVLDQRVPVVIEPDRTTDVSVEALFGGRVRLVLPERAHDPADSDVELSDPPRYVARAVRPDGRGAVLLLVQRDGSTGSSFRHGAGGAFPSTTLLAPGRWRVQLTRSGTGWAAPVAEADVDVRERAVADVQLSLAAGR